MNTTTSPIMDRETDGREELLQRLRGRYCPVCGGTGTVRGRFYDGELWEATCSACEGTGQAPAAGELEGMQE